MSKVALGRLRFGETGVLTLSVTVPGQGCCHQKPLRLLVFCY